NNPDIFQRAMTPGAPAAAGSGRPLAAAVDTSDTALPVPAEAGAVLPSELIVRLPALHSIRTGIDCPPGNMQAQIEAETAKARELATAYCGNPGNRGLERTRAEGAVLERAGSTEIYACAQPIMTMLPEGFEAADAELQSTMSRIAQEQQNE